MNVVEGQYVLLEFEDSIHLLQAKTSNKIKLKKGVLIRGKDIIGKSIGIKLTVDTNGNIEKASQTHHTFAENYMNENINSGDGSKIIDSKKSHTIDHELLENIKQESSNTHDIVTNIISKSNSFHNKTRYSQYKYIIKKLKKYHPIFIIYQCDCNNLCRFYFQKMPEKIQYLRPDRLAQILHFASISYNSNILVLENTQGLIIGSLVERITIGKILHVYFGNNLPDKKALEYLSININSLSNYEPVNFEHIKNNSKIITDKFHSLIIVSKFNPLEIVQNMLPFLLSSSPIVVFSQVLEPLVEVYSYFKQSARGFDMYITETWLRSIKVQENSTHPNVLMDDRSGYIFRCYFIN